LAGSQLLQLYKQKCKVVLLNLGHPEMNIAFTVST